MSEKRVTVRVARWSATHPWLAITGWLLLVVICLAGASVTGTNVAKDKDFRVGEAGRADAIMAEGGLSERTVETVLITSRTASLNMESGEAAAQDIAQRMRALPVVANVAAPVRSTGGDAVMVRITMKGDTRTAEKNVTQLLAQTAATQAAHPGLRVAETGHPSKSYDLGKQRDKDLALAEQITLPITLVIMLLVFGAIVAAVVPVLLAVSSVAASMGLAALASHVFPDAGMAGQMILLMGMAVGVDYSLFYLKREREERARSGGTISHAAAVELAAATSGHTIVVSGFAVIVSMAAMYLIGDVVFSSLATGAIIVVAVAMVGSLTVLPALLAKVGRWVDRPRVPLLGRSTDGSRPGRLWPAMLRPAMRHPVITLLAGTAVMGALALPLLNVKLTSTEVSTLPKVPAVQTSDRLTASFPTEGASYVIAVRADQARSGDVTAALADLTRSVRRDPLFAGRTTSQVRTSVDDRIRTVRFSTPYVLDSTEAKQSLQRLRQGIVPTALGRLSGIDYGVTGDVAESADLRDRQTQKLPPMVGFVLLVTFIIMARAFRSVVIALMAIVLNLLAFAASYGAIVAVFQYDWADGLLGSTPGGVVLSRVPVFLFAVLFGLSMDYHVFVVSRIREKWLDGVPTRRAVFEGITGSAGVITSAAIVMVSVFVSFMFNGLLEVKEMGFGLAVAVLLDAFIVRIMILPSLMSLLGDASWWPSLRRRPPSGAAGQVPAHLTSYGSRTVGDPR